MNKNTLKTTRRKLHNFVERVKMSELDYLVMKEKSEKFDKMMSTISIDVSTEYKEIKSKNGDLIYRVPRKQGSINVDTPAMLKAAGIIFDSQVDLISKGGYDGH